MKFPTLFRPTPDAEVEPIPTEEPRAYMPREIIHRHRDSTDRLLTNINERLAFIDSEINRLVSERADYVVLQTAYQNSRSTLNEALNEGN